MKENLDNQAQV